MKRNFLTITAIMLVLTLAISAVAVGAAESGATIKISGDAEYSHIVIPSVISEYELSDPEFFIDYRERYAYYSASSDEATPDYVLIDLTTNGMVADMPAATVFFDRYVLSGNHLLYPFTYGYGIYIPSSGEIHDLPWAYEIGIEGLDKIFTETRVGSLIGDMDSNRVLNVKDATLIQKCLAGIEKFNPYDDIYAAEFDDTLPLYYCDFNFDHKRDIKDATAIQKYIAGLDIY